MSPLDRLSLQHLLALDALLAERHVTRAASRLGRTPSAVSHALSDLRDVLGDPLFVRAGGAMVPTPRALLLVGPLRRALADLDRALTGPAGFDPATAERTFTLRLPDSFTLSLLPPLLDRVRREAPGVGFDILPPAGPAGLDDADLAVLVGQAEAPWLRTRFVRTGRFACCVRADHPDVGDALDLDTYCRLPHALMSPLGHGPGTVDTALAALGRSRRVQLRIRYVLAAPLVVAQSDLVLTGPDDLLHAFAALAPLRVLAPPLAIDAFPVRLAWHERLHGDPGHRWLREQVAALLG